jgi:hypothetical protein
MYFQPIASRGEDYDEEAEDDKARRHAKRDASGAFAV